MFAAENKVVHLSMARKCGLGIPSTVFGNSPEAVRNAFSDRAIAFKSFRVPVWAGSDIFSDANGTISGIVGMTSKVASADALEDQAIRSCSNIFQEYVEKSYEVRVLWCGGEYLAVSIDSQANSASRHDWKIEQDKLKLQRVTLPLHVVTGIESLMSNLSIEIAAIDFIVGDSGDYVFLELNTSGQFLWMDRADGVDTLGFITQYFLRLIEYERNVSSNITYRDFTESPSYSSFITSLSPDRFAMHSDVRYGSPYVR